MCVCCGSLKEQGVVSKLTLTAEAWHDQELNLLYFDVEPSAVAMELFRYLHWRACMQSIIQKGM